MGDRRVSFGNVESSTYSKGSTIGTHFKKSIVQLDDIPASEKKLFQSPHKFNRNISLISDTDDSNTLQSDISDSDFSSSFQVLSNESTSPVASNVTGLETSSWITKLKANPILWEENDHNLLGTKGIFSSFLACVLNSLA